MAQQTAKERAEEIVNKFIKPTIKWNPINGVGYYNDINAAKECALVLVDEILKMVDETMQGWLDADIIAHWKQVKTEIEKL
jgi:hypothetical protein